LKKHPLHRNMNKAIKASSGPSWKRWEIDLFVRGIHYLCNKEKCNCERVINKGIDYLIRKVANHDD